MKINELLNPPVLLEGRRLTVYEGLLPLLLMEEGEVPTVVDITGEPVQSPSVGTTAASVGSTPSGWGRGPLTTGMGARHWVNEFYRTLKSLVVAKRMLGRMTQLGISKEGKKRVKLAAKTAARNVNLLLSNPGATAYRIPQWTFDRPKAPVIKRWNEGFAHEFKKELARITEYQMSD